MLNIPDDTVLFISHDNCPGEVPYIMFIFTNRGEKTEVLSTLPAST